MTTDNERQIPEGEQNPEGEKKFGAYLSIDIGVKPGFMLRKVGKAYMVMPTGPRMKDYEGMITLNETGAFLFKESQKPEPTREKLIEACKAEYGAEDEEAAKAVDAFVLQCANCGIFEQRSLIYDKETGEVVHKDD